MARETMARPRMRRGADTPADDPAGIGVDDEGDIDEALPSGDIGEIRHPEHVGCQHPELAVHLVQRTGCLLVGDRCPVRLAPDNALNTHALHQPPDRAAGDIEAFAAKLPPDLPDAVDPRVLFEHATNLGAQRLVPARTV